MEGRFVFTDSRMGGGAGAGGSVLLARAAMRAKGLAAGSGAAGGGVCDGAWGTMTWRGGSTVEAVAFGEKVGAGCCAGASHGMGFGFTAPGVAAGVGDAS
jgi:hypothetical protein